MGIFSKFTGPKSKWLGKVLESLPIESGTLPHAREYVLTGKHPEVLTAITAGLGQAGSRIRSYGHNPVGELIRTKDVDDAALARLADVWNACGWTRSQGTSTAQIDVRTEALLHMFRMSSDRTADGLRLLSVLIAGGHPEPEVRRTVLAAALAQMTLGTYSSVEISGIGEVVLSERVAVAEALGDRSHEIRSAAVVLLTQTPGALVLHLDRVLELTRDSSKQVREAALNALDTLPDDERRAALERALEDATPVAARQIAPRLGRDDVVVTELEIPPYEPLPRTELGEDFVTHMSAGVERALAQLRGMGERDPSLTWVKEQIRTVERVTPGALRRIAANLSGTGPVREGEGTAQALLRVAENLASAPGFTLRHAIRYVAWAHSYSRLWSIGQLRPIDADLRAVDDELEAARGTSERRGVTRHPIADSFFGWNPVEIADPAHVWPYFAEHQDLLEVALGLRKSTESGFSTESIGPALGILATFPVLPAQLRVKVEELAVGEGKMYRERAQDVLARHGGFEVAVTALDSSVATVRAAAGRWLARIVAGADPAEQEALRERATTVLSGALTGEKREVVQAAYLGSLRVLGSDLSTYLAPAVLQQAAVAGLKKKAPVGMDWLPLDRLPALRWADGSEVAPETPRWWCVLAVKLKDPAGEGLIPLYVSLLDEASQRDLGSFILGSWVGQDLRRISDEEIRAEATKQAPGRYAQYQRWSQQHTHMQSYGAKTIPDIEGEITRELQGTFLGTAIKEKGLLALTPGVRGLEISEAITRYAKRHPERRSQIEVLVTAAAQNDDPAALQAVISIARGFKQRTVKEKAGELVEQIAERRGWSTDELADRTIPTAGFPSAQEAAGTAGGADGDDASDAGADAGGAAGSIDNGVAVLDFGSRQFTMRIADDLTLALFNAEGKQLKALPSAGVKDDADLAKAARATFSAAKKELTQVVELQSARLQEAMSLDRSWSAGAWRDAFGDHPVMRHLVARLVWATGPGGPEGTDAADVTLFAPTLDGEVLDAEDGEVELADDAPVWLAHASRLTSEQTATWTQRFADYGITPLFAQLEAALPELGAGQTQIIDREGWIMTIGALRTRATKLGYRFASAEDGGWIGSLIRDVGPWQIVLAFSGTYPGQDMSESAAVQRLSVQKGGRDVDLGTVPPVLLAVVYGDYLHVAAGGAYDPEWSKRAGM